MNLHGMIHDVCNCIKDLSSSRAVPWPYLQHCTAIHGGTRKAPSGAPTIPPWPSCSLQAHGDWLKPNICEPIVACATYVCLRSTVVSFGWGLFGAQSPLLAPVEMVYSAITAYLQVFMSNGHGLDPKDQDGYVVRSTLLIFIITETNSVVLLPRLRVLGESLN